MLLQDPASFFDGAVLDHYCEPILFRRTLHVNASITFPGSEDEAAALLDAYLERTTKGVGG